MSLRSPAPTPTLPTGAGGPLRRAAGRASASAGRASASAGRVYGRAGRAAASAACAGDGARPAALLVEPDPLVRLLAREAAEALGFAVCGADEAWVAPAGGSSTSAVVFMRLELAGCAQGRRARPAASSPLRVGYTCGWGELPGAHRLHGCCDTVLELRVQDGQPRFSHPPHPSAAEDAGLTAREADVLLLLCAGSTTAGVAERLRIAPATARSHCRSVLRKLGAADRRELRRLLVGRG